MRWGASVAGHSPSAWKTPPHPHPCLPHLRCSLWEEAALAAAKSGNGQMLQAIRRVTDDPVLVMRAQQQAMREGSEPGTTSSSGGGGAGGFFARFRAKR